MSELGPQQNTGDRHDDPMVSVVVPTHLAAAPYLQETLESVQAQTYQHWELLLIADHIEDVALLESYVANDERMALHSNTKGRRVAAGRNTGLDLAVGKYIAFLDHDDVWFPNHLETNVRNLLANPEAAGAFTSFQIMQERILTSEVYRAETTTPQLVYSGANRPGITTLVAPTELVRRVGGFSSHFAGADDLDIVFKLIREGNLVGDPEVTVAYRVHPNNWSKDTRDVAVSGDGVFEDHINRLTAAGEEDLAALLAAHRRWTRNYYASRAVRDAWNLAKRLRLRQAASSVRWAHQHSPEGVHDAVVRGPLRWIRRSVKKAIRR